MKKRYIRQINIFLILVLVIILLSSFSAAEDATKTETDLKTTETFDVTINLIDLSTNHPINNVVLDYKLNDVSYSTYLEDTGVLNLKLAKGEYSIKIEAYESSTPATDYYTETSIDVSAPITTFMYLYPVGFVRGFVKDNLDNIVPKADIKFECVAEVITKYPKKTEFKKPQKSTWRGCF